MFFSPLTETSLAQSIHGVFELVCRREQLVSPLRSVMLYISFFGWDLALWESLRQTEWKRSWSLRSQTCEEVCSRDGAERISGGVDGESGDADLPLHLAPGCLRLGRVLDVEQRVVNPGERLTCVLVVAARSKHDVSKGGREKQTGNEMNSFFHTIFRQSINYEQECKSLSSSNTPFPVSSSRGSPFKNIWHRESRKPKSWAWATSQFKAL